MCIFKQKTPNRCGQVQDPAKLNLFNRNICCKIYIKAAYLLLTERQHIVHTLNHQWDQLNNKLLGKLILFSPLNEALAHSAQPQSKAFISEVVQEFGEQISVKNWIIRKCLH